VQLVLLELQELKAAQAQLVLLDQLGQQECRAFKVRLALQVHLE
jgi:hypothetical protein